MSQRVQRINLTRWQLETSTHGVADLSHFNYVTEAVSEWPGGNLSSTVPAGEWQGIEVSPLLGWAMADPWMISYNNFVSELHSIM